MHILGGPGISLFLHGLSPACLEMINSYWMRVAELNITDTSQQCPVELVERNETGIRSCELIMAVHQQRIPRRTLHTQYRSVWKNKRLPDRYY